MRFGISRGLALSGPALVILVAGCSGGNALSPTSAVPQSGLTGRSAQSVLRQSAARTSVLPPGRALVVRPDTSAGFVDASAPSKGEVFVSDAGLNDVFLFSAAGKPEALITGFSQPQGLGVDSTGNLYVANTNLSEIVVYKTDYKTIKETLDDSGQYPVDVKYDVRTGLIGVTNIISTSDGPGSVSFFAKGSTSPCVTVSNANWGRVYFGAFAAGGDFFIDGEDPNGNTLVGVVHGGCSATGIATLSTGNAISFPGGVQVTPNNQIVVDDQLAAAVYTYAHPTGGSLGSPLSTTFLSGSGDTVQFTLHRTADVLWTADAELASSYKFPYPAGGSPAKTISGLLEPIGVAENPLEAPF